MTKTPANTTCRPEPAPYEIRLLGHLDMRWATQLDAVALTHSGDGTTLLSLAVADQSALHGLLQRIRDLGQVLISVTRLEPAAPTDTAVQHQPNRT